MEPTRESTAQSPKATTMRALTIHVAGGRAACLTVKERFDVIFADGLPRSLLGSVSGCRGRDSGHVREFVEEERCEESRVTQVSCGEGIVRDVGRQREVKVPNPQVRAADLLPAGNRARDRSVVGIVAGIEVHVVTDAGMKVRGADKDVAIDKRRPTSRVRARTAASHAG